MFDFLNKKARPIGLDIGHNDIRMIQLADGDDDLHVVAAEKVRLDPELGDDDKKRRKFIVSAISEILVKSGFRGRNVVSCLPNEVLKIKSLRLDTTSDEQIKTLMEEELAQKFDLDPLNDEVRYIRAGNVYHGNETKSEIIFFGTEKENIVRHITLLEEAGLRPVAIDIVPLALFRTFQTSLRRQEDEQLISLLLDVGTVFTTAIIGRGKRITFVKQIPIAGYHFNEQVASKLGISVNEATMLRLKIKNSNADAIDASTRQTVADAMNQVIEKLVKEISLCVQYYSVTFRGERPAEAVFAGGEAYETMLLDTLKRHLGVEIKVAQPLRGFDLTKTHLASDGKDTLCEWAVAVGLAMKGWEFSACGTKTC